MSPSRRVGLVAALVLLPLGLTACRGGSSDSGSSDKPVTVDITEKGGTIEPVGMVVEASTGQTINLVVTSDADDEIHVHSDPEHEFEVHQGDTEKTFTFSVDTPGTIEVESHVLEVTILKLEVR